MKALHTTPSTAEHSSVGTLHMVCGKIASGKSTLAKQLALTPRTVLISEDTWLAQLYPTELRTLSDYALLSGRIRTAMGTHIAALLKAGTSVVLDFPSNNPQTRAWARSIFEGANALHFLHYIDVPDEMCRSRLHARNQSGEHPFQTTGAQFDEITRRFVAPSSEEGFNVIIH